MGVKNLWDILESCKKTLPLHHLQNKRVCVDLSCWMVQLQNVNKSHCPMKDKLYLKGLFHRLRALIALNCSLVFVTDGAIPAIKLSAYRRRLKSGGEASEDEANSYKVSSLQRNMGSEFSRMIKEARVLGMALGIPCLDGIEEAEAQCALLNSESLCDGCFSSDSDIFLFGARTVYRDICLGKGEGGYVVCYEMAEIERKLGFGRNSLITLAVLLGSDYSQGVHCLGPESACRIIKYVDDEAILHKLATEGLSLVKKLKTSIKQPHVFRCNHEDNSDNDMETHGRECDQERDDQFMRVINAYLKPKCHTTDSDAVHRVLAVYPFQRGRLQQICAQFFQWSPEKTDEYILCKIAERDLRRFANLRSTSSELGVQLSLDEMPVKCPISGIIKRRKVKGRDYFEVSWVNRDGLDTSVVPADLVESACLEKILDFEARRDQVKKQNKRRSKTKISENRAAMNEIDLNLRGLLLDLEHDNTGISGTSSLDKTNDFAQFDPMNPGLWLDNGQENADVAEYDSKVANVTATTTIIDLMSPSPAVPTRSMSERQEAANVPSIDVINLSDSETEMSPQHAKKARELRLFLASIREDIY